MALRLTVPLRNVAGSVRLTVGPVLSTVTLNVELLEFVALSVAVTVYDLLPAVSDPFAVCSALT